MPLPIQDKCGANPIARIALPNVRMTYREHVLYERISLYSTPGEGGTGEDGLFRCATQPGAVLTKASGPNPLGSSRREATFVRIGSRGTCAPSWPSLSMRISRSRKEPTSQHPGRMVLRGVLGESYHSSLEVDRARHVEECFRVVDVCGKLVAHCAVLSARGNQNEKAVG